MSQDTIDELKTMLQALLTSGALNISNADVRVIIRNGNVSVEPYTSYARD